jgi:alkanesulfonate monooxygenase SsuD/methylene tetrahydromethanopterin reductase-like flavin-dependent oxidoreductase (luciferase family)
VSRALPLLGVTLPQFSGGPKPALTAVGEVWALGYAGAFVFDHLWPLDSERDRPILESWTLLAALAGRSGSLPPGVRPPLALGTLVTRAGLRPPALLARMAATVGEAAGTPAIVGVGAGDAANRAENLAFGLAYRDAAGRAGEVERAVAALRAPMAGRPQVWVGGNGPRMRAVAGATADAWNAWGALPEELATGLADVQRSAERSGRDPAAVAATWGGQALIDPDPDGARARLAAWGAGRDPGEVARTLCGDPAAVMDRLAALRAAGASWCVLSMVGGGAAAARAALAAAAGLTTPASTGTGAG